MLLRLFLPAAVVAYALVCGCMFASQRNLLYLPSRTRVAATSTTFSLQRGDVTLRGWVIDPKGRAPIIYFGGNAEEVSENRADFARWFAGHSVYLLAYRGYGASDGTPNEADLFADAVAEFDRIARLHPGQPITVIGRSLGTGVASYLAAQRPVAKLALVTPYDSIATVAQATYWWLPVGVLLLDRFDSAVYLQRYRGPLAILRANEDAVIPPTSTDRLIAALPERPTVFAFPGRGHGDISDDPRYGPALRDFIGEP